MTPTELDDLIPSLYRDTDDPVIDLGRDAHVSIPLTILPHDDKQRSGDPSSNQSQRTPDPLFIG